MPTITPPSIPSQMLTDDGSIIHFKVIPMGPWNMNLTTDIVVNHGLGALRNHILFIQGFVIRDNGVDVIPLEYWHNAADPNLINAGIDSITDTQIGVRRRTGGSFITADFDDGVINRGWLSICYFE